MTVVKIGKGWFPEEPGGLNRYFYDCIHNLQEAKIPIHGLVAGSSTINDTKSEYDFKVEAFSSVRQPLLRRLYGIRKTFNSSVNKHDISLVVSHFSLYTFPILDQLHDLPLIIHFHGPWSLESKEEGDNQASAYAKNLIERACYRKAEKFIVLSQAFKDILHKQYKVPMDQIYVVPGAVDLERFKIQQSKQKSRELLMWKSDRPTIFVVRRLAKRMGLENLIEAIAEVKHTYPDVLFKIAGKGPLKSQLERQIKDLDLNDQVHLLGYVSDEKLPLMYRAADFSVVPTVSLEGFGLIVIESLAAGTPVLATPIGGIPEILNPLSPDLLLESSNFKHIAEGICEVLNGKRELPSAHVCESYVKDNFSWSQITEQLKIIYGSVTNMTF